jgi:DNA replication and repair protein RecF
MRAMRLIAFESRNFRCLGGLVFQPEPGINVVCGNNAQGKTSLLEAILYTATSKSHRTSADAELVAHGADLFHLTAQVQRQDRQLAIDAAWWRGVKRFKINGVPQTRISDILGKMTVVLFSPEDIALIKGAASGRRRFLDMELSQVSPPYLHALQRYRQALRQRNELLRTDAPAPELIAPWDEQLSAHAETIVRERNLFIEQLARHAADAYARIADGEQLALRYVPDVPPGTPLAEVLVKSRQSDIRRQNTLRGPHRDDLEIDIASRPARNFASQGQQKTAALALKLAELNLIRDRTGEHPILMLDEVLSELDAVRSRLLFNAIPPEVQCIVTTTTVTRPELLFGAHSTLYDIEGGQLEKR